MSNSPSQARRHQADAGVQDAIQSVLKNQKFKRMMVFGLRSLSDLCVPPTVRYKENSLAILESECFPVLISASANFQGDDEVALLLSKCFFGLSEVLKDEPKSTLEAAEKHNFSETVAAAVGHGTQDNAVLGYYLDTLRNFHALGIEMDTVKMAPGLLAALNPKMKGPLAARVFSQLQDVSAFPSGAEVLGNLDAIDKILAAIAKRDSSQSENVTAIACAFNVIRNVAAAGKSKPGHLDSVIAIMDASPDQPTIQQAGSGALGVMVGPDVLKQCLNVLKTADHGSPERAAALTTLSSMSYISSCADQIVKAGGVPMLCDAVAHSAKNLEAGQQDTKVLKGLVGACRILATVGRKSSDRETIVQSGGLEALCDAARKTVDHPDAFAAACGALLPLVEVADSATKAAASGVYKAIIDAFGKPKVTADVLRNGMAVLAASSTSDAAVASMMEAGGIDGMSKVMKSPLMKGNNRYLGHTVTALSACAKRSTACGPFNKAIEVITSHEGVVGHRESSLASLNLMKTLAALDGGVAALQAGNVVDLILQIMLAHGDSNKALRESALSLLDILATEKDVTRTLQTLDSAVNGARNNPQKCLKSLAAVNGLSQVSRLAPILVAKDASPIVLKGLQKWVEGPKFDDQQKIIKAGCACVQSLTVRSSGNVERSVGDVVNLMQLPGLKGLREKQDVSDNSLVDLAALLENLCATQRFDSAETVGPMVDGILRAMRKQTDARKSQLHCINSLNYIAQWNEEGARKVVESGALRSVIAYMQKVAMYEDVQVAGLRLMHTLALHGGKTLESLKAADAVPALQSASRRFHASPEVKKYVNALLSYLVPEGEVERLLQQNQRDIEIALQAGDLNKVATCFKSINEAIVNPEASKIAAKVDMGRTINNVMTQTKMVTPNDERLMNVYTEIALTAKNMSQKRVGVNNLQGSVKNLVTIFEALKNRKGSEEGVSAALTSATRLLQRDRDASEVCFKRGFPKQICLFAEEHDENENLFAECAAALAAMRPRKTVLALPEVRRFIGNLCTKIGEPQPKENLNKLIEALEEMLMDPDDEIVRIIIGKKGLAHLYKVMDDHVDDLPLIKRAQRCADLIARQQDMRMVIKKPEGPKLETMLRVTRKVVQQNKRDPDVCANAIRLLNLATDVGDRKLISEYTLLNDIEELMEVYPEHGLLMKACGEYLGKLGADEMLKSYMRKIIDHCNNKPANYKKLVEKLNQKLAMYLAADVDDPVQSFALTQECLNKLADLAKENPDDAPLLSSIGQVTRRLVNRFKDDPDSPYGVKAMCPKMMPTLTEMLSRHGTDPIKRPRKLLCDGFHTLAGCARSPAGYKATLDSALKYGTIPYCLDLLKHHENDPEVVAAILDYLAALASQPEGAEAIATLNKTRKGRRLEYPDTTSEIMALMKRHRKKPPVLDHGYDLIGNLNANQRQMDPSMKSAAFINELDTVDDSPSAIANVMRVHKKLIGKEDANATAQALRKANEAYTRLLADDTVSDADKAHVAAALAEFTEAAAAAGCMQEVKKSMVKTLVETFENHNKELPVLLRTLPALTRAAATDADISAKLARTGIDHLLDDCGDLIHQDPEAMKATLEFLKVIVAEQGNGAIVAKAKGYSGLLAAVENMCPELDREEATEIKALAESIKRSVADDQPEHLTLQQVLSNWSAAKKQGEVLDAGESQAVLKYLDFVTGYTEEYSKEPHQNIESELGKEWRAGCQCYQLLHELPQNSEALMERQQENSIFLRAMARQKNEAAVQPAVLVVNDAVQWPEAQGLWAATPNAAAIVGECLQRGRRVNMGNSEKEALLIPRLQLVERFAVDRCYFNSTECMGALIGLWDDYDAGKYSVELLKQVFKSMRKIVNDHWVAIILKNNVPARLIEVVNDKQARIDLLPDVLFLLAALAVVPEIKTMIGDLKGVEACLDLLQRSLKANPPPEGSAAVQTNDCLALSAITLGHGANLNRFVSNRGLELNIQAMEQSMTGSKMDFDVANAASLLMCNTCFKRDEMKEMYGKKGACQAVMRTINAYDGSEDAKAFRCLGTMFKAIGNLALFTPNVDIFMDGRIEKTFADLYGKSDRIPDQLVEASLRTLSNLAMENTEANMQRFGVCLPPIIQMLKQGQRSSVTMFTLAFDVLGALCRLPMNSKQFLREDGIATCLRILNSYCDNYLYANGIHVLGIQTTNPNSIPELISSGVFDFLTSLLESQNSAADENLNTDLAVSGLRCIRRLFGSQDNVLDFIRAGGLSQTIQLTHKSNEYSMMHMEACRVVLNALALFPPPPPPPPPPGGRAGRHSPEDDWDGDVADEGVLPVSECLDRPPSPRAWESLELNSQSISTLIEGLLRVLDRDENLKQNRVVRCVLGLLAYLACEKVPETTSAFYGAGVSAGMAKVLEFAENEPDVVKMACYVINNVAFMSEPELYITLRKEKIMRKNLDNVLKTLGSSGGTKAFADLTLKLLNERSGDPSRFSIHQQWDFPLEMTWWDKDKYPNGVQDLPAEIKEELRAGGKMKTVVGEKDKELVFWKSSLDLVSLNWRIAPNEGPWQHSMAISRFCSIAKGLQSDALRKANELGSTTSKPREGECLVLAGPPTEEFPNGVELSLICGSKRHRDKFFDLLNEWREAAAFGF